MHILVLAPRSVFELLSITSTVGHLQLRTIGVLVVDNSKTLPTIVKGDGTIFPCPLLIVTAGAGGQNDRCAVLVVRSQALARVVSGCSTNCLGYITSNAN